jgi:hypothetical protein
MTDPSPRTHLYRLGLLLILGFVSFVGIVAVATPPSWNYEVSQWYRLDAVKEAALKPSAYGGIADIAVSKRNDACKDCHEKSHTTVRKLRHKKLSCESCHGALADHVQEGKKVAVAVVDKSTWQCMNCHRQLISRPKSIPQFSDEVAKHAEVAKGEVCLKCHDAHDPTP